ncbi:MAG TPA: hypothetical protein VJ927_03145 [Actinomycetota bacterium]|nr:hypothetical protein [Actinomycetota bacterium]
MRRRLIAVLLLAFAMTPLAAPPAQAGIVCNVAQTVMDKYFTDISGHYGDLEDDIHAICAATP